MRKRRRAVTWPSAEDAAKDPVFDRWTCPKCAWTEFDLVEAEAEPQPDAADSWRRGRRVDIAASAPNARR